MKLSVGVMSAVVGISLFLVSQPGMGQEFISVQTDPESGLLVLPPQTSASRFDNSVEHSAYQVYFKEKASGDRIATIILDQLSRGRLTDEEAAGMLDNFSQGVGDLEFLTENPRLNSGKIGQKVGFDMPDIIDKAVDIRASIGIELGYNENPQFRHVTAGIISEEMGVDYVAQDPHGLEGKLDWGAGVDVLGFSIERSLTLQSKQNPQATTMLERVLMQNSLALASIGDRRFDTTAAAELAYRYNTCRRPPLLEAGCPDIGKTVEALKRYGLGNAFFDSFASKEDAEKYIREKAISFLQSKGIDVTDETTTPDLLKHFVEGQFSKIIKADAQRTEKLIGKVEGELSGRGASFDHDEFRKEIKLYRENLYAGYQIATLFAQLGGDERMTRDIMRAFKMIDAGLVVANSLSTIAQGTASGAALGPYGAMAGAFMGLMSAFSSGNGGDDEMRRAFQQLNIKLDRILEDLNSISGRIDYVLKNQQLIMEAVRDNAFALRMARLDILTLERDLREDFLISQRERREIVDRIEQLAVQMAKDWDQEVLRDQEQLFLSEDVEIDRFVQNPDDKTEGQVKDLEVGLAYFLKQVAYSTTFVRPLAPLDGLKYPAAERAATMSQTLADIADIVAQRKQRIIGMIKDGGGELSHSDAAEWLKLYEPAKGVAAVPLPHPDYFLYFYKRYAELAMRFNAKGAQTPFALKKFDEDIARQERTVNELLRTLPPLTTTFHEQLGGVANQAFGALNYGQMMDLGGIDPIADAINAVLKAEAEENPETATEYRIGAWINQNEPINFIFERDDNFWEKVVGNLDESGLVWAARSLDMADLEFTDPVAVSDKPLLHVYFDGMYALASNGVPFTAQQTHDFLQAYGIFSVGRVRCPTVFVAPVTEKPPAAGSAENQYQLELFDKGTCKLPEAVEKGMSDLVRSQVRCSMPPLPAPAAQPNRTELLEASRAQLCQWSYQFYKNEPFFKDIVGLSKDKQVLHLKKFRKATNIVLTENGAQTWIQSGGDPALVVDTRNVLFPRDYEEWETLDGPMWVGDFDGNLLQNQPPEEISRIERTPSPEERPFYAESQKILKFLVLKGIENLRTKHLAVMQEKFATELAGSVEDFRRTYAAVTTASEWALGECIYTDESYTPFRRLVNGIPAIDLQGKAEMLTIGDALDDVLTSNEPGVVIRRIRQLQDIARDFGPEGLPYKDFELTRGVFSDFPEVDPQLFYAPITTCNVGLPPVLEMAGLRKALSPLTSQ